MRANHQGVPLAPSPLTVASGNALRGSALKERKAIAKVFSVAIGSPLFICGRNLERLKVRGHVFLSFAIARSISSADSNTFGLKSTRRARGSAGPDG